MIRRYLEFVDRVAWSIPGERTYSSYEGLVLAHGCNWTPTSDDVERGPDRLCFMNALLLALELHDACYVEGYAFTERLALPLLHAWVGTQDGRAIDPTWEDGAGYFGIALDPHWVKRLVLSVGVYGVIANNHSIIQHGLPQEAIPEQFRKE